MTDTPRNPGTAVKPPKSKTREWLETILWAVLLALGIRAVFIQAYKIPTGSMQPTLLGAEDYKTGDHLLVNKFIYGSTIPFTTTRFLPTIRKPLRGDVIVFFYPKAWPPRGLFKMLTPLEYVKRCIGLPGETIQVSGKDVIIDGKTLGEPWLTRFPREMYFSDEQSMLPVRDDLGPLVIPRKGDVVRLSNDFIIVGGKAVKNRSVATRYNTSEGNYFSGQFANYFTEYYQPVLKQTSETTWVAKSDCYWGMGDNRDNSSDSRYWGFIEFKYLEGVAVLVYWPPINKRFEASKFRLRVIH